MPRLSPLNGSLPDRFARGLIAFHLTEAKQTASIAFSKKCPMTFSSSPPQMKMASSPRGGLFSHGLSGHFHERKDVSPLLDGWKSYAHAQPDKLRGVTKLARRRDSQYRAVIFVNPAKREACHEGRQRETILTDTLDFERLHLYSLHPVQAVFHLGDDAFHPETSFSLFGTKINP